MATIAIIGGGLVGLGTALGLRSTCPAHELVIIEKEEDVALHQSSHNSGVLHCGLYYQPGSLKARLAVNGIRQMIAFCQEHGVAHEVCGKIVLAVDDAEVSRLRDLHARGTANGLRDLRWLSPEEINEREPYARGKAALLVPEELSKPDLVATDCGGTTFFAGLSGGVWRFRSRNPTAERKRRQPGVTSQIR